MPDAIWLGKIHVGIKSSAGGEKRHRSLLKKIGFILTLKSLLPFLNSINHPSKFSLRPYIQVVDRTFLIVVKIMHPPLTLHRHPMCAEIIEQFQKCHLDHPIGKFFGECTDLKLKLDHCFRQEKALKRKANFEESKKLKERLQAHRKELAERNQEDKVRAG